MSKIDDAEINEWYQSVYKESYHVVYRSGKALIYRYCRDLLPDLEDLVQETFEDLYRKKRLLRNHANIIGWLIVALRFNFKNRLRKWRRWKMQSAEVDSSADLFSAQTDSIENASVYEEVEALNIIREVIGNEGKYRAFLDYHIHKVPIRVLAEQRGITENAMKMQLYRCRKLCAIALREHGKLTILLVFVCVTLSSFVT